MISQDKYGGTMYFEAWSNEEKNALHKTSMRILEEIGVNVYCEEAIALLKTAGAEIDGNLAKINEELVMKALDTAPSIYSIFTTDGEKELVMEPNKVYFGTGTDMPDFIDLYTGEIRLAKLEDCENAAKVANACDEIDWIAPVALANDKDPRVADLYHFKSMRTYSNKPNLTLATDAYSLKGLIDMSAAQAGGYEELAKRPTMVHYAEPISPLLNAKEAVWDLHMTSF